MPSTDTVSDTTSISIPSKDLAEKESSDTSVVVARIDHVSCQITNEGKKENADERLPPHFALERARRWFRRWKPLLLMVSLNALYGVAANLVNPIYPEIKRDYFGSDQKAAFVQTLLDALSAAGALFLAPLWGLLLDTAGRRPFFLFNAIFNVVPLLLLTLDLANPLPSMIAVACGNLVTSGHYSAYLADCYSPRLRLTAFAVSSAASNLTSVAALFVLGLSNATLVLLALSLQVLAAIVTVLFVRESLARSRRKSFTCSALVNPFTSMKHVFTSKVVVAAVCILGVLSVSQSGIGEVYMYFLNQRVGFTRNDNATIFLEMGILNPLMLVVVAPLLTQHFRIRQTTLVLVAIVALSGEMTLLCLLFYKWQIWALGVPIAAITVMGYPAVISIVANGGAEEDQGKRQAGFAAINDLFATLAPLFFGQTYSHLSGNWVMLPFMLAGIICIPTFFVGVKLREWIMLGENEAQDDEGSDGSPADARSSHSADSCPTTPLMEK